MDRISFRVAPYALQDTLDALLNRNGNNIFYNDVAVTKEDGELVILVRKVYLSDNSCESTICGEVLERS